MGCNYHKIKGNPELQQKESNRISSYLNDKYKNDEEFREKKKQYQKEYRERKRIQKQNEEQSKTETFPDIITG